MFDLLSGGCPGPIFDLSFELSQFFRGFGGVWDGTEILKIALFSRMYRGMGMGTLPAITILYPNLEQLSEEPFLQC